MAQDEGNSRESWVETENAPIHTSINLFTLSKVGYDIGPDRASHDKSQLTYWCPSVWQIVVNKQAKWKLVLTLKKNKLKYYCNSILLYYWFNRSRTIPCRQPSSSEFNFQSEKDVISQKVFYITLSRTWLLCISKTN